MRYLRFTVPAAFLLAAASYAAATQSGPQVTAPAATSGQTAPARTAVPPRPSPAAQAPTGESSGERANRALHELRQTLWRDVLGQYPPSVGRSVQQKPLLLSSDDFLARYPALEAFLKEHPEVRMNQGFFFPALPQDPDRNDGPAGTTVAILIPLSFFALIFGAAYLAKQRALATIQARQETTAKLIDGLLAREDLVSHLDTPAGRRIIDSLTQRPEPAPASRIIRSVQAGVVVTFLGLGFVGLRLFVAVDASSRTGFSVVAVALTTIGAGLLVSAGVSYLLSRRLGLIETSDTRD